MAVDDAVERLFKGTECLAPMVRAGSLPLRLLALQYGADTVWGEELVDRRVSAAVRHVNHHLGTIDYVNNGKSVAFRTCDAERGRVVFQLGTSDAARARAAAEAVARDVAAVDVNMGCPKRFSIQGGMGAALLTNPDVACDIIATLRRALPVPVTAKIRLLDTAAATVELARRLEAAGAAALTVHARLRSTDPKEPALWDMLRPVVDSVGIPVIANGDIYSRADMATVRAQTGCASVMLARPALLNCSVFDKAAAAPRPQAEVLREYVKLCSRYGETYQNAKYTVMEMMTTRRHPTHLMHRLRITLPDDAPSMLQVSRVKALRELALLWRVDKEHNVCAAEAAARGAAAAAGPSVALTELAHRYDDDFFLRPEPSVADAERVRNQTDTLSAAAAPQEEPSNGTAVGAQGGVLQEERACASPAAKRQRAAQDAITMP